MSTPTPNRPVWGSTTGYPIKALLDLLGRTSAPIQGLDRPNPAAKLLVLKARRRTDPFARNQKP